MNSAADCWGQRTGNGGWHIVFYADSELELHRRIKPQGVALDLVGDGYAVVAPSITKGPYCWQSGHSPSDIPLADLASPPAPLVTWWRDLQLKAPAQPQSTAEVNSAYTLLGSPIPNGSRVRIQLAGCRQPHRRLKCS